MQFLIYIHRQHFKNLLSTKKTHYCSLEMDHHRTGNPNLSEESGELYYHECCEAWSQYPLCLHTLYAQPESFEWDDEYAQLLDYLNGQSVVRITSCEY